MEAHLERVRSIVRAVGKLPEITPDEDYYDAGFSSLNALDLLLELETAFDVSIPDDHFVTARTARDLYEVILRLKGEPVS